MSCNGCRVLRKGCSETCVLRPCLQWIETPEAQGHATVFVAKFFGRAGLMSFISAVPESQRPALFQSLLFEACGRTVNPVHGAVGLLWMRNWNVCQAAVETVLRGGTLRPMPELFIGGSPSPGSEETSEVTFTDMWNLRDPNSNSRFSTSRCRTSPKRKRTDDLPKTAGDLDLRLTPIFEEKSSVFKTDLQRPQSPSMNSEESVTMTCFESGLRDLYANRGERKLLNLFA